MHVMQQSDLVGLKNRNRKDRNPRLEKEERPHDASSKRIDDPQRGGPGPG